MYIKIWFPLCLKDKKIKIFICTNIYFTSLNITLRPKCMYFPS